MSSIVTFYSFKGGVGRSMAVANIAVLLARRGLQVLAVDWDLEAPGLERYFEVFELRAGSGGLLPFFIDADMNLAPEARPEAYRAHVWKIDVGAAIPLALLPSGRTDHKAYASQLEAFQWRPFFARGGGEFMERLREVWRADYDVVLIDSRTGMSDSGGICTIQMPDVLVGMFTANTQSLYGLRDVIASAQDGRQRLAHDRMPLTVLPIASRISATTEFRESQIWMDRFVETLGDCFAEWLPKEMDPRSAFERFKLPQIDWFGFGERLAVVEQGTSDMTGLGAAYDRIAEVLASDFASIGNDRGSGDTVSAPASVGARQSESARDVKGSNDYLYDVYVSYYRGGGIIGEWTQQFVRTLQEWLTIELPEEPQFFYDASPSIGLRGDAVELEAIRRSKVMLAVLTPAYFASNWCVFEWSCFAERKRRGGARTELILPLVVRGRASLPSPVRSLDAIDAGALLEFGRPHESGRSLSPTQAFILKHTVEALASMIRAAPRFRAEWPVVPDEAEMAALRAQGTEVEYFEFSPDKLGRWENSDTWTVAAARMLRPGKLDLITIVIAAYPQQWLGSSDRRARKKKVVEEGRATLIRLVSKWSAGKCDEQPGVSVYAYDVDGDPVDPPPGGWGDEVATTRRAEALPNPDG